MTRNGPPHQPNTILEIKYFYTSFTVKVGIERLRLEVKLMFSCWLFHSKKLEASSILIFTVLTLNKQAKSNQIHNLIFQMTKTCLVSILTFSMNSIALILVLYEFGLVFSALYWAESDTQTFFH